MNKSLKLFKPRYLFSLLYIVLAGYLIVSELGCKGWNCDLVSGIVILPWSVWLTDFLNFFLANGQTYFYKPPIAVYILGVSINTGIFYLLGLGVESVWSRMKSLFT